jgi:nicotinamide-nucleotide amidase
MWPAVIADPTIRAALAGRDELRQQTIRLWGTPESELAATLRGLDDRLDGLEITTCLHDGEVEIVTRYRSGAEAAYQDFATALGAEYRRALFSADGRTIDDIVAEALLARGQSIATAESCTGGLLVARLTERPGSSAYVLGGVTSYANEVKQHVVGVPAELIARFGAVSAEVAESMATGIRTALSADVGVGITGIAGPDGGTPDKPVGLVHLCVADADRALPMRVMLPGNRADVRKRAVVVAMHLLRRLLTT